MIAVIYGTVRSLGRGHFWYYLRSFLFIVLIAYLLVYAVYFLFTLNYPQTKQLADAEQILASFSPRWLAEINLSLIKNNLLRPLGEYLLGLLMVLQRSSDNHTGYFLGEVSATGSRYYFPLVFLMKEPLPSLLLILIALGSALSRFKIKKFKNLNDYLGTSFEEFAMFLFIIIYWGYSIRSSLNIGVRHLLPTIPFIYILTALGLKKWILADFKIPENLFSKLFTALKETMKRSAKIFIAATLIIWFFGETISAFPYFLSYFNEAAGGTKEGYRYVTDSNYDWGQDLKRLARFTEDKGIKKIAVDYFGGGNTKYYLGENVAEDWRSTRGNPKDEGIEWLAVSVNTLQGAFGKLHQGQTRKPEDEYSWLKEMRPPKPGLGNIPEPDYRAGTSIFIYHF
jgi:hypothetical protein